MEAHDRDVIENIRRSLNQAAQYNFGERKEACDSGTKCAAEVANTKLSQCDAFNGLSRALQHAINVAVAEWFTQNPETLHKIVKEEFNHIAHDMIVSEIRRSVGECLPREVRARVQELIDGLKSGY